MNTSTNPYTGHRCPAEIISHTVWHNFRFTLSFRDIEELLASRGVILTYETIRQWCPKFGKKFAKEVWHHQLRPVDTWYLDEMFVTIGGKRYYLGALSIRSVMYWIFSCRNIVTNARLSASLVSF